MDAQEAVFRQQLRLGQELQRPISVCLIFFIYIFNVMLLVVPALCSTGALFGQRRLCIRCRHTAVWQDDSLVQSYIRAAE